ncbi:MAG: hypothetical protein A2Z83_02240 [Omnitrophica bacterium GWA2_52_8]|nr:MAG: hypothetical protein A2Z83_02240 [Omnitrophica bacterium GWA2_52_8]
MAAYLFSFATFFILASFFAGAEMAFISGNKLKIRQLAMKGNASAKRIMDLLEHPQHFLTTLQIATNTVHVIATMLLTLIMQEYFKIHNEWVVTAVMAPLFIIFAEMVPKDYCRIRAHDFLLDHSVLLDLISKGLFYPTKLLMKAIRWLLKPLGSHERKSIFVNEREFRSLIEESARTGVVSGYEKKMIDKILDFERTTVASVLTPLKETVKVDITQRAGDVKELARQTKARMVLVYEEEPGFVVGMVYVFDLLFEKNDKTPLKTFLRSPVFLTEETSLEKAFLTLQARRQSYAVVTDKHGDVLGSVPIERLIAI